jgi:hypothetical protein
VNEKEQLEKRAGGGTKDWHLAVIAIIAVLLVTGEQVVDGQVHVQVGALKLTDDERARAALQHALGLSNKTDYKLVKMLLMLPIFSPYGVTQ